MTHELMNPALALLAGIAIAAACGLRAFLPLLVLGVAARFGGLPLPVGSRWLGSDLALIALGGATIIEIVGDKVPVVDHALDVIASVVRPVAATIASYGLLAGWQTPWSQIAAVMLGGTALAVHMVKAKTRVGATALSFGVANPWLSVLEDGLAMMFIVIAILAPLLVLVALALLALAARRAWRHRRGRRVTVPG